MLRNDGDKVVKDGVARDESDASNQSRIVPQVVESRKNQKNVENEKCPLKASSIAYNSSCFNLIDPIYSTRAPMRGTCVILSVDKFDAPLCLPPRTGSGVDVRNVCTAFASLEFNLILQCNKTASEMRSFLKDVADQDHTLADCFACVILTHGDDNGLIYARDGAISLDQLIAPFRGDLCASLRGKPKMFFVQACRGTALDAGTLLVCDSPSSSTKNNGQVFDYAPTPTLRRIPIEADLFIAYAVQPGYYAFRNSVHGSWFIRALSETLLRYGPTSDLLSMMTRVNYSVAYDFESLAVNPVFSGKKQMPSFVSTLTKKVIFPPKQVSCDFIHPPT